MLTERQRRRCAAIAQALDAGDQRPWLKAEPSVTAEERGLVWDLRLGQRQREEQRRQRENARVALAARPARVRTESRFDDLDFWGDQPDDMPEDDGPVCDDEEQQRQCPACDGKGLDASGVTCSRCGGTGRVRDDVGDEEDEEARSYGREFEDED